MDTIGRVLVGSISTGGLAELAVGVRPHNHKATTRELLDGGVEPLGEASHCSLPVVDLMSLLRWVVEDEGGNVECG
eukprot:7720590-Pyramimonas_sp.AAC.1